ncbi:MAG: PKD domain-containing protein, partial [Bacteroidia bacterium]
MKQFLPKGLHARNFFIAGFFILFCGLKAQEMVPVKSGLDKEKLYENMSKIPVSFRQNVGQWEDKILYQGSSPGWGANIYFMKDQISFGFTKEDEEEEEEEMEEHRPKMTKGKKANAKQKTASFEAYKFLVWNMHFKNESSNVRISAEGVEDSHTNYLVGDVSRHKINVPDYRMVHYKEVYTNIDARYYSTGNNLKYDFILKPNSHITDIQLECDGIKRLDINEQGQLEITTKWGKLLEEIPESYQLINGEKKLVKINYRKIDKTTFGFEIKDAYDPSQELVIDPINLSWSTFVGGPGDGYISDIAVDASGCVYGTGWYNTVFPTTPGAYQQFFQGGMGYGDTYVFKLSANASSLVYSTYLGGTQDYEQGEGIAVNAAGQAYVTGWTQSPDFPTTAGAYGTTFNYTPPNHYQNIFITKLNASGTGLVYSNLIGGIYSDYAYALELNAAGEVFVTGYSTNFMLDFPTTPGAYQPSASTSNGGVYVLKLNAAGSNLVYSTFTGNPSGRGYGLAIDGSDNAYITGGNYGNMDVSAGAFQAVASPMIGVYPDCFVQKINSTGTALSYSTYLGGSNSDDIYYGDGIDVDNSGNAYVFGFTQSSDFPVTAGSYDVTFSGGSDPFLTKLNPTGTALVYSTFVGQDGQGESIEVNAAGEAFVAGNVGSPGFTATACAYDASQNGGTDCFIGKINAAGTNALYLSYFGGTGNDYGNGPFGKVKLVLWGTCQDELFVCTTSHSTDFPTTAGVVQASKLNGGADQPEVFHLKPQITPNFTFTVTPCNNVNFTDISSGTCIWQSGAWTPTAWQWYFGDGGTSTAQNPTHTYGAAGTYNVKLVVSCPKDSITIPVTVTSSGLVFSLSSTPAGCASNNGTASVNVTTGTGPFTYTWAPTGGNASTATNLAAGNYSVNVSNGSCSSTGTVTVASAGGSPPVTSAITGSSPVCQNQTSVTYSVTNTAGSTYSWTVPAGATITAGQGTNSITITWGSSGGTVSVTETNACGTGTAVTTSVSMNSLPSTSAISGPTPLCPNATGTTYSVTATAGSTYMWTVPAGAAIISGQGTNSVTVNWTNTGGNVSVTETNGCGSAAPVVFPVVMNSAAVTSAITGPNPVCP